GFTFYVMLIFDLLLMLMKIFGMCNIFLFQNLLNLIPKIHSLSPLDLIHLDVCEMNGILTRAIENQKEDNTFLMISMNITTFLNGVLDEDIYEIKKILVWTQNEITLKHLIMPDFSFRSLLRTRTCNEILDRYFYIWTSGTLVRIHICDSTCIRDCWNFLSLILLSNMFFLNLIPKILSIVLMISMNIMWNKESSMRQQHPTPFNQMGWIKAHSQISAYAHNTAAYIYFIIKSKFLDDRVARPGEASTSCTPEHITCNLTNETWEICNLPIYMNQPDEFIKKIRNEITLKQYHYILPNYWFPHTILLLMDLPMVGKLIVYIILHAYKRQDTIPWGLL
ncbi:hypothetical protein ACJX0J_021887, partial [Zea mays]